MFPTKSFQSTPFIWGKAAVPKQIIFNSSHAGSKINFNQLLFSIILSEVWGRGRFFVSIRTVYLIAIIAGSFLSLVSRHSKYFPIKRKSFDNLQRDGKFHKILATFLNKKKRRKKVEKAYFSPGSLLNARLMAVHANHVIVMSQGIPQLILIIRNVPWLNLLSSNYAPN